MGRTTRVLSRASFLVLVLAGVPAFGTIVVDGLASDWGAMPPLVSDANEGDIPDKYDIQSLFVTHDLTTMFFRLDVYDPPPTWTGSYGPYVMYRVGLDTDYNAGTGYSWNGLGMETRIDYKLNGGPAVVEIWRYSGSWSKVGNGVGGMGDVVEMSGTLSQLGVSYPSWIRVMGYLDNAGTPPEDFAPGANGTPYHVPEPGLIALGSLGLLFLVLLRRRSRQ